jgi:uncharacterized protein
LTPKPPEQRLPSLDALRGFALFGVLLVNLVVEFRVSIFQQFAEPGSAAGALDQLADVLVRNVFELKAYALFSLLFGVGLAAQRARLETHAGYWLTRRLAILLIFGAIHLLLIWNGDILVQYAIAGFLVLPFVNAPVWATAFAGCAMLLLYFLMPLLPMPVGLPPLRELAEHVADAAQVLPSGSYADIRRFSWEELPLLLPLHVYIFPRTLGLMLLGMVAWRVHLFSLVATHRWAACAASGASLIVGAVLTMRSIDPAPGAVYLALGYAGLFLAAFESGAVRHAAGFLIPVGRMAFTNYIVQSIVMGWIFFGYGLGLYNRMGAAAGFALAIAIFAAQAIFSAWWLKRWRFGPIEWLWRSLMYGRAQPITR